LRRVVQDRQGRGVDLPDQGGRGDIPRGGVVVQGGLVDVGEADGSEGVKQGGQVVALAAGLHIADGGLCEGGDRGVAIDRPAEEVGFEVGADRLCLGSDASLRAAINAPSLHGPANVKDPRGPAVEVERHGGFSVQFGARPRASFKLPLRRGGKPESHPPRSWPGLVATTMGAL
jgi:hypothetical protein